MGEGASVLETRIRELEAELYTAMRQVLPQIHQTRRWETQILRWCMDDESLRTQVLRFIDCLPALQDAREVVRHLKEYFPEKSDRLPLPLRLGLAAARPPPTFSGGLTGRAVAAATRHTVSAIARFFLAGADLEEAFGTIRRLEQEDYRVSVDLLGEATISQNDAERYTQKYLELIQHWRARLTSRPHVSLKLSSLAFPFDPVDPERVYRQVRPHLSSILQNAAAQDGFVNVDMEQYHWRDLVLQLTQRLLEESFPGESRVGVVIQSYLKDSEQVSLQLLEWARARGTPITVRLVRGAYWDSEVILAQQHGWPCPVYTRKADTDASFERLTDLLLENHETVRVAIGTHNLRSIARAIAKAEQLQVPPSHWECQVLYGMGEAVQQAVRRARIPVRIYTPVGELIPGMAYLVRRILENTSQNSFLAMSLLGDPNAPLS